MNHLTSRLSTRICCMLLGIACKTSVARQHTTIDSVLPVVFQSDFSCADDRWETTDPEAWQHNDGGWLSLHVRTSRYEPPVRSPLHIALLRDMEMEDFVLDVSVRSTNEDYGHRDLCLFFGYQRPDKFYYAHLGKQTDERCNQIFIVNQADRIRISEHSCPGIPWDDQWHKVRIERNVSRGEIRVYFDDMIQPVMTAQDKTFTSGRIGLGSFDDTGDFDNLSLRGNRLMSESGNIDR